MYVDHLENILEEIDRYNGEDPNTILVDGINLPAELIYGQRMYDMVHVLKPNADHALLIAARAQHIQRWKIARTSYSDDREGYLRWRNDLKKMHAIIIADLLHSKGCEEALVDRVVFLVQKKDFKRDTDSQTIEDAACLVFLQYYFDEFAGKTEEAKVIDIIKKTWIKMSEQAKNLAFELPLSPLCKVLVGKALNGQPE